MKDPKPINKISNRSSLMVQLFGRVFLAVVGSKACMILKLSYPSSFLVLCLFLITPCLLLLIYSLYENDSRETMLTCARMFPDVQPWEVTEICRHSKLHSLESTSADFVFYVEQLMRWRTEVGNTR